MIADESELRAWMVAGLAGDATAYRRLLVALSRHLRAFYGRRLSQALQGDAEDLVQETLIAMHMRRGTYDPAQPLTAWVYAIARYKLIDYLRRRKVRQTLPLEDAGEILAGDESESAAAKHDIEKLLARLPAKSRAVLRAVKLDGLSVAETAAQTGMSESAVKVSVHRAMKNLASSAEGSGDENR